LESDECLCPENELELEFGSRECDEESGMSIDEELASCAPDESTASDKPWTAEDAGTAPDEAGRAPEDSGTVPEERTCEEISSEESAPEDSSSEGS
jgi:hypothetical protein